MAMAATLDALLITLDFDDSSSSSPLHITMLSSFTLFLFVSLSIFIFTAYTILKTTVRKCESPGKTECFPAKSAEQRKPEPDPDPANLSRSLLLEILPSNSAKWEALFGKGEEFEEDGGEKGGPGQEGKRRKKKRGKKKRAGPNEEDDVAAVKEKESVVCVYPFTKSCSATQRKIKQQYDQLVRSHGSNGLTLAQIGQFVNCLVEARNELQNKSEVIKRRFTITKALLCKADRSSFDRLRQQIYKLELEQKRLEEDAFVYNWLQDQLKLSPAYKKMIEMGACIEAKAQAGELVDTIEPEFSDISFEELLAKEKKDSFWQRHGKLRSCSS
ncbi:uncharacterized protein LOC127254220 [Andrographis paniculata]|uniref:uncharacterized protein LOC127254220 n=1 Tax=Andrographis paniculata TaxID=175694 RepID=UPI0021E95675|nr:uncharacterized protein LOC127254220 [Andrographis paniculata]